MAHGVPVKTQAFAGTHFASSLRMARLSDLISISIIIFSSVNKTYRLSLPSVLPGVLLSVRLLAAPPKHY